MPNWQQAEFTSVVWERWERVSLEDDTEQRNIVSIVVNGVRFGFDGLEALSPDGVRLKNACRGQMRNKAKGLWTVYADGGAVPGNPETQRDCAQAIAREMAGRG